MVYCFIYKLLYAYYFQKSHSKYVEFSGACPQATQLDLWCSNSRYNKAGASQASARPGYAGSLVSLMNRSSDPKVRKPRCGGLGKRPSPGSWC